MKKLLQGTKKSLQGIEDSSYFLLDLIYCYPEEKREIIRKLLEIEISLSEINNTLHEYAIKKEQDCANKININKYSLFVDKLTKENTSVRKYLRVGQRMFNCLSEFDKPTADKLLSTDYDPFYDNSVIPNFLKYLKTLWSNNSSDKTLTKH